MTDGKRIFDDAAELAFPRYPGSDGDARAITWLEKRIQEIGLDGDADEWGGSGRGFKLVLRIFDADEDNLLADLEAFPLSKDQSIEKEKGTNNYLLTARKVRGTHQLIEWILGMVERVEVGSPATLRNHMVDRIDAMRSRYT